MSCNYISRKIEDETAYGLDYPKLKHNNTKLA